MSTKRYCLVQDNDSHWYVIPAAHRDDWSLWLGIDSRDERSWDPPEFAQSIDGPHSVEFFGYVER